MQEGKLECILESVDVDTKGIDIFVGQINGWTDSTALISIVYHRKSMNIPISSDLKGVYKGTDIYFYQSSIDTLDNEEYQQIPNNINWNDFTQEIVDDDIIQPPYDPISVQVEYNIKRNCIGNVVKGKGFIMDNIASKCNCKNYRN